MENSDWQSGVWHNPEAGLTVAEIIISGDWAPIRKFGPIIEKEPSAIYGELLEVLRGADLRITNLEAPLGGDIPQIKSGAVFKGGASHVKGLTAVPFEVVTLANNHVFDYGLKGFQDTRNLLTQNSVRHLGAGGNRNEAAEPVTINLKGINVAIVNFSEGEDLTGAAANPGVWGWEIEGVIALVKKLRSQADVIIVIAHAGIEYIPFPPPYIVEAYDRISEAGADLIIGHHPHVPQGMKIHRNVPVCYSLGNFVFYQETELYYRKIGYLVKAGISKNGLSQLKIIPYRIDDEGLVLLKDEGLQDFFTLFKNLSLPLAGMTGVNEAWNGFLRYYGVDGFKQEIAMIMAKVDSDLPKAAAMFRNRITTMQHREHWLAALNQIIEGRIGESQEWAYNLNREFFTRKR
jgi:poly-gamma-glutamate synthesis protein (capsule biosynthesis protein)